MRTQFQALAQLDRLGLIAHANVPASSLFPQALRSRDSLQLEYTDCLLDKNRLRKHIAELQASLEQQQRELERERSSEQMKHGNPCLNCVSSRTRSPFPRRCVYQWLSAFPSPTCPCAARTSVMDPAAPLTWT